MKPNGSYEPHLAIREMSLLPGMEWSSSVSDWLVIQISAGNGYWLHVKSNRELEQGVLIVLAPNSTGVIRASQVAGLSLIYFSVDPMRLSGLITIAEQNGLQTSVTKEEYTARIFPRNQPLPQRMEQLLADRKAGSVLRVQLLQLFLEIFGNDLNRETPKTEMNDAKARLWDILQQVPASELLNLSFADLVRQTRCTPRHLSRIFREVVGMSFRDKHAELRLTRACELLATTEAKVVDVALESGYQSLSLFNLMFARRFGISPGKWRQRYGKNKAEAFRGRRKRMYVVS